MTHDEQLAWEQQAGRPAAAAAFGSAVFGAAAIAIGVSSSLLSVANDRVQVVFRIYNHKGAYIASQSVLAISMILIAPVLYFLYRAARYRRPEVPRLALYLAVGAPVVVGLLTIASIVNQLHVANIVGPQLPLDGKVADHLVKHQSSKGVGPAIDYLALISTISLAFAIGFNSINARRAGLLSQFMGILGVIVGVLLVIPLLGPPLVQFFWFVAVGLLFIDRWPGNRTRGPAWETGEADPWPTAAEIRAEQLGERAARAAAEDDDEDEDGDYEYEDEEPEPVPTGSQHPRSKKRKRKRRR